MKSRKISSPSALIVLKFLESAERPKLADRIHKKQAPLHCGSGKEERSRFRPAGFFFLAAAFFLFMVVVRVSALRAESVTRSGMPEGAESPGLSAAVSALTDDAEGFFVTPASEIRVESREGDFQDFFWLYEWNNRDSPPGHDLMNGFVGGTGLHFLCGTILLYDEWGYEIEPLHFREADFQEGYAFQIPYFIYAGVPAQKNR